MTDTLARNWFLILWLPFVALRLYWHWRSERERRSPRTEGWPIHVLRAFFLLWFGALTAWLLDPSRFAFARWDLPSGVRWLGAGLFAAGELLVYFVHRALGSNFTGKLSVREGHALIESGPYRWVRHPMYTAFAVMMVGMLLLSANLLLGLPLLLGLAIVLLLRTPREEAMMLDQFGERYRSYMARTGRYLPKLRRATAG